MPILLVNKFILADYLR